MKVSRIKMQSDKGSLKAFVDLEVDGWNLPGLRVVSGKNGLFVSMPQREGKDKKWYDIFHPISKEKREEVGALVLKAYYDVEEGEEGGGDA